VVPSFLRDLRVTRQRAHRAVESSKAERLRAIELRDRIARERAARLRPEEERGRWRLRGPDAPGEN